MYNLKIKEKRAKSLSTKEEIGLENLSFDDEWLVLEKHMENIVLYLLQKHVVEYKRIYFTHVRLHVTSEF